MFGACVVIKMSGSGQSRKYLSGARKRKIQQAKLQEANKIPKISRFFTTANPVSSSSNTSKNDGNSSINIVDVSASNYRSDSEPLCSSKHILIDSDSEHLNDEEQNTKEDNVDFFNINPHNSSLDNGNVKATSERVEDSNEVVSNDLHIPFRTDIALFSGTLSEETKKKIIAAGPNRPMGPFPRDPITNRSFSSDYYYTHTKTGQRIERFWLCYSQVRNTVYCQPCWLFCEHKQLQTAAWRDGSINDWQGLSKKIKTHEDSASHFRACISYTAWEKNKSVDTLITVGQEKIKQILIRICDVIRTLALGNVPFRGHRENISQIRPSSGNFLNFIELLARYDPLLRAHISNNKSRNKYLSPEVQNELITLLSQTVLKNLISKVTTAPFFSIILDTTQDISKKDQLSIVVRYVNIIEDQARPTCTKIEINESFLGFIELTEQNSENFETVLINTLEHMGIDIKKCRGQGYDGAANMSGKYSGLQARIKRRVPNADYVHCAAHNLNLVLNDSVKNISEIRNFYDLLQNIYVFFSESLPRWQELNKVISENGAVKRTLKKLCPTRWSSRFDCLIAIKYNYESVLKCLTTLALISKNLSDRNEASSLQNKMMTYEFILLLVFQSKVLEVVNLISKQLQTPDFDLGKACSLINNGQESLSDLRNNFNVFEAEAVKLAETWGIQPSLTSKRQTIVKKFYDELACDIRFHSPLKRFQIKVFNECLDIIINQLRSRFTSMNSILETFSFLHPQKFAALLDEDIIKYAERLEDKYDLDFSHGLSAQLVNFKNAFCQEIKTKTSLRELADFLLVKNNCIASSLPDVCTLFQLYLTLPITSSTAERSFSKLKLIKTYLRSTMSQIRLSSLAIISIEKEESLKVDLEKLIQAFLLLKKRRFGVVL